MRLSQLGEFGLIDRIAARVSRRPEVRIGIGDDAAALEPTPGCLLLVTADMLLEGVHFDLSFCSAFSLGRKTLAVNLSDIAAMGGEPRHCLLSLGIPPELPLEFIDDFVTGLLSRADEFGVVLVGGDTCASRSGLVINLTLMGEQRPEFAVTRSGARAGDLIMATGTLGDSALGLSLLRNGERQGAAIKQHLDPTPRVREGLKLAEGAYPSAMIDISDGLLADLGHILKLSGRGARVELAKLPVSDAVAAHIERSGPAGYLLPLAGGEDYELLFTISPERKEEIVTLFTALGTPVAVIGEITLGDLRVIAADGSNYPVAGRGYDHFS